MRCLSCQQQREENNNKVVLALEENYRKEVAEKDRQGQYMNHKGIYFRSLVTGD